MTVVAQPAAPARSLVATATEGWPVDPIGVFGAARAKGLDAWLWHVPAEGRWLVGIDVVARLTPAGPGRFERLAAEWRSLATDIRVTGPASDSPLAGPILMGGATFRDQPSTDPRWAGLRTAVFGLPRLLLASDRDHTVLTEVTAAHEPPTGTQFIEGLVHGWREHDAPSSPSLTVTGLEPDQRAWAVSVARIAGAVGRGRLDKVVLARRVDLAADRPIDVVTVLRRLVRDDTGDPSPGERLPSTVFACGLGDRTFLGSSPELAASVRGSDLRTMGLAGTAPRDVGPTEDAALAAALLASEKDREEHLVVTTMLRETLTPLTTELSVPRTPRVVRSARLHHLLTDVTGTLRPGIGLLDVLGQVHPTPAVAGWPTHAALELLDEETTLDRGWYAGPVGWVDRHGDGALTVAIRSGLVHGHHASLFAGCGIVADSEVDLEWSESALKLRVMGEALGWDGT